ncbi:MAG TPA: ABC transporter permease [Streptosporangiaceae bacterium]|jgi:ribose transport system permease protein
MPSRTHRDGLPSAAATAPGPGSSPAAPPASTDGARRVRLLANLLRVLQIGPALILIVLALVIWSLTPTFISTANIQNILIQSSVVAILALGELIVIITGGIDLSVSATMALATVIGWTVFQTRLFHDGAYVIGSMVAVGLAVGLVNGLIYVKGRVPHPFIATLATLSIATGLALTISKGQAESGMPSVVNTLGNSFVGIVPVPAIVLLVVAIAAWWLTRNTRWGRWIYATGGNPEAAKRVGIPVGKVLISVYMISGLAAGIGAVLTAGSIDGGSATLAEDPVTLLNAIAGVIIGGASLFGGRGSVWNAIIGALTIGVIENGLALENVSPFAESIFVGVTILVAVELDVLRSILERRIRTLQANLAAA